MCGIIGWLGDGIDPELALRMRDTLSHRGPDDAGYWYDKNEAVWLGQRRLSIIDLTVQGHQPMQSGCGRYVLTYNGEIYNFKDLRQALEQKGHAFRGESDTEVLLHACMEWGVEIAVKKLEGMFAFGFYDRVEKMLWLVRDPMGIKPLYYAHTERRIAFASELTPLIMLPWVDRGIDQDALFSYFRYGYVPAPASILKGVRKVSSGEIVRYANGCSVKSTYWSLSAQADAAIARMDSRMTFRDAADMLEERLRRSVRLHMQSDVPYGAFLSGGVDSSAVVAMMQAESTKPVKTFAIGFSEASHDESIHARAVADHLGTEHHELILSSSEIPHLVPGVAAFFDEPFADNSAIPTYLISRFARESVTVCLSGDGGDELFGGYPRYFWANRIESLRKRFAPGSRRLAKRALQSIPSKFWDSLIDPALRYRFSGAEGLSYRVNRFASYLGVDRKHAYAETMSVWRNPEDILGYSPKSALGPDADSFPCLTWSEEMMLNDQRNFLQDDILTKVDRASMAASLESRVPLLANAIVEFSWEIPESLNLAEKGDRGKMVLRDVLYRYVPKDLIERPKQGFGMPIGKWLRGDLREWAESLLEHNDLEECGLNSRMIRKIWEEHQNGVDRQAMLWSVLMFRQWCKKLNT